MTEPEPDRAGDDTGAPNIPGPGGAQGKPGGRAAQDDPMTPPVAEGWAPVNCALTPGRRRRVTENDAYAAFARRVLRAWARRVAAGDIDAITDMAAAIGELEDALRQAVAGLRGKGYSWADIGDRLGVTRQAAQQRWRASGRDLPAGPALGPGWPPPSRRSPYAAAAGAQPGGNRAARLPSPPGARTRLPGGVTC